MNSGITATPTVTIPPSSSGSRPGSTPRDNTGRINRELKTEVQPPVPDRRNPTASRSTTGITIAALTGTSGPRSANAPAVAPTISAAARRTAHGFVALTEGSRKTNCAIAYTDTMQSWRSTTELVSTANR